MIACDVVLLPPEDVQEIAVELNRKHSGGSREGITLDKKKCLPHITLAMGCIDENDVDAAGKILSGIAASFPPIHMRAAPAGERRPWIRIEKSRDIELMHELVMIRMEPFLSFKVSSDMVYREDDEVINDMTLDYIRKFHTDSCYENYIPHITVGTEEMDIDTKTFDFISDTLALCHLGNYCTCRKVLNSHTLAGPGKD